MKTQTKSKVKCECGNPKESDAIGCTDCVTELCSEYKHQAKMMKMCGQNWHLSLNEYLEHFKGEDLNAGKCCFCGGHYIFGGHNPSPAIKDDDASCCAQCNYEIVIPLRRRIIAQVKN